MYSLKTLLNSIILLNNKYYLNFGLYKLVSFIFMVFGLFLELYSWLLEVLAYSKNKKVKKLYKWC